MAEYISNAAQTVAVNGFVTFPAGNGCCCERPPHRAGSGLFTLRGGRKYRVYFSANVSAAVVGASTLAITTNGEAMPGAEMVATSAAAGDLNNVSAAVEICVPKCCCYQVGVKNVGAQEATVQSANIIIDVEGCR